MTEQLPVWVYAALAERVYRSAILKNRSRTVARYVRFWDEAAQAHMSGFAAIEDIAPVDAHRSFCKSDRSVTVPVHLQPNTS